MEPEKQALVAAWVNKAKSDIATAKVLICGPECHLDTGVYHCQQAAEKVLKGFLTAQDIVFPNTHNLLELVNLGAKASPELLNLSEKAANLTPFATEFRYPGDALEPALSDAKAALQDAMKVMQVIESLLDIRN